VSSRLAFTLLAINVVTSLAIMVWIITEMHAIRQRLVPHDHVVTFSIMPEPELVNATKTTNQTSQENHGGLRQ